MEKWGFVSPEKMACQEKTGFLTLSVDIIGLLKNLRVLSTPEKNLDQFLIYDHFNLLKKLPKTRVNMFFDVQYFLRWYVIC